MRNSIIGVALATLACTGLAAPAAAVTGNARAGLAAMQQLNVLVFGDFTLNAGEVEGKTFVLGNLSGSNAQFAFGNGAQGEVTSTRSSLTVGGNVSTSSIKILNGSNGGMGNLSATPGARIGGSVNEIALQANGMTLSVGGSLTKLDAQSGSTTVIGGNASNVALNSPAQLDVLGSLNNISANTGTAIRVNGSISGNQNYNGATHVSGPGSTTATPASLATITAEADQLRADVRAAAAALGGLTVANNASTTSFDGNNFTFNAVAGSGGFALFDINAASTSFRAATNVVFAGATTVPIIVNVRGFTTETFNFNSNNGAYNQSVIWNFLDATTINLSRQWNGSILAPEAIVNGPGTPIEGSIVARMLSTRGEIHLGTYGRSTTFLPENAGTVPEPASWALLVAGFAVVGAAARRRRPACVAA